MEIRENIINMLSCILNLSAQLLSDIQDEESLRDYGLNSIRGIELVVRIELDYGIEIEEQDLLVESYDTIKKIIELVNKYTKAGV